MTSQPTWRKSSFSGGDDPNCVEVAHLPGAVAFRDSKNPDGPLLVIRLSSSDGQPPGHQP